MYDDIARNGDVCFSFLVESLPILAGVRKRRALGYPGEDGVGPPKTVVRAKGEPGYEMSAAESEMKRD